MYALKFNEATFCIANVVTHKRIHSAHFSLITVKSNTLSNNSVNFLKPVKQLLYRVKLIKNRLPIFFILNLFQCIHVCMEFRTNLHLVGQ